MRAPFRIAGFWLAAVVAVACAAQAPDRVDGPAAVDGPTDAVTGGLAPNCSQAGFTVTCTFNSGSNTFTVPKGVSTVHVVAVGGAGGSVTGADGGHGAVVTADLDVSSIATLYAVVGGNGGDGFGGDNGGGGATAGNGGGGGASDVRTGPDLASRLLVAAGGGGGGIRGLHENPPADPPVGGAGGQPGSAGGAGHDGDSVDDGGWISRAGHGGGAGGSGSGGGGGSGGVLDCAFLNDCPDAHPGCTGSAGTLGGGGTGGFHATDQCHDGGGGGGGRYGGGGGGGGDDYYGIGGAGGGGGGSNLVPTGGSAGLDATGVPVIVLSYTAAVVVSPTSVTFGDQAIGSTSTAKTATLSVTGTAAVAIDSVTLGGANAGDFAIAGDTCSAKSVAAGETCTVQITFQPTATGVRSASLAFHDDATDSPQVVTLSGNGTTSADVGVTITGPAATKNNSQNSYVVKVTNAGPSQALGVTMTAQVPPGTRFAGVSTTQGTCTNPSIGATTGTITCALGDLAKDAAALDTVTLRFSMNGKGGSIALTARATSASTPDPSLGNNVASINTAVGK